MTKKTKGAFFCLIIFTIALMIMTIVFWLLHRKYDADWMMAVAITLLTFLYHFAMRLIVGEAVTVIFKGRDFPQNRLGFRIHDFEKLLYRKIGVKKWKANTVTAKPEQFDIKSISPNELLHNVMQAELVHRIIMILSFVPVLFIIPFGQPTVFIITSIFACFVDMQFVIIQRFNRPRVITLISMLERKNSKNSK